MRTKLSSILVAATLLFALIAAAPAGARPATASAADLRAMLTSLLGEHTYLAASATNAALGGRDAEFKTAAATLDANSVDLAKAIGSVYGKDAETIFLGAWRGHIGFFVDYTTGLATKDKAKQDKAVQDLLGYTQSFGTLLNQVKPNLPKDAVADLVKMHVLTLKDVVDAQAAGDQAAAYAKLRAAYAHMTMIADPLASAIVKQFPDKFGGAPAGGPAMLPKTGGETPTPWRLYAALVVVLIGVGGFLAAWGRRSA